MSEAGEDTKRRLLEAAERVLIEDGAHALTIRRVGAVSAINPALITYHFGGIAGLLAELCRLNLEPIVEQWRDLDRRTSLRGVLHAWLGPLTGPAAFTPGGRALLVFDEIASHGEASLREALMQAMLEVSARVQAAVRPFTPHLGARELRARVRFIAAAALGPPPRASLSPPPTDAEPPLDGLHYLLAFAEASLLGPPADR